VVFVRSYFLTHVCEYAPRAAFPNYLKCSTHGIVVTFLSNKAPKEERRLGPECKGKHQKARDAGGDQGCFWQPLLIRRAVLLLIGDI